MNRRRFFQRSASVMVSSLIPHWAGSAGPSRKQRIHIGAETNAFGVPIKPLSHLLEFVSSLSKLGYEGFETNTRCLEEGSGQPAKVRREFEARDIRLISAYSHGGLYTRELAEKTIAENRSIAHYVAAMGASYLILGGPRLHHVDGKLDMTAVHNTTEGLNRLGEAVQKEGLKLCYHNHWMEFEDHPSEMSFILKETDPKLVWVNYDIGNCYIHQLGFGPQPAAFSREHVKRIAIYHVKDVGLNSQGKAVNTELGAGRIDLKGVVAPLLHGDWEGWLTVEQEGNYPKGWQHPVAVMRQARDYLRNITGV
jgi:sugar phosphate isomerase/epimerase